MEHTCSAYHILDVGDEQETAKKDAQKTQKPNLEKMQLEELMQFLGVNQDKGLSSEEAARRLEIYGPNLLEMPIEEDTKLRRWMNKVCLCLKWDPIIPEQKNMMRLMLNPISWAMVISAVVTAFLYAIGGDKLYLYDALAMTSLLLLNYASCYVAMIRVRNEKAPLIGALKPKVKVLRDGRWREQDPANLVPGDIIFLKWGDIVPADIRILKEYTVTTKISTWSSSRAEYGSVMYYQQSLIFGEGVAVVIATGHDISAEHSEIRPSNSGRPGQLRQGVFIAANFCCGAIVIGTLIEVAVTSARNGYRSIRHDHLILLIGGLPMAMPAIFYLCLACGSRKLCQLGVASRGTMGLEDLATIDTVFFNMTGTLTLNEPKFDRNKIEVFQNDMDVDDAILVAAKANLRECDLYKEPIDAAILDLLSNADQALSGIEIEGKKWYSPFNVFRKKCSCEFHCKDGRYFCALKGDPEQIIFNCEYPNDVENKIVERIENLACDGYETLAIALKDTPILSPLNLVALMPFKVDLREDCVETIHSLNEMGLRVIILTGGRGPIKKEICTRLGILPTDVYRYENSGSELSDGLLTKANLMAITGTHSVIKEEIVSYAVTDMGYRCAIFGGGKNDFGALKQSHVAICGPNASDKARSLSDLVLTTTNISPFAKSAQVSRAISQMLASYLIFAVSSTVHVFGILLISLIWKGSYSCFLVLVMAFFNYCLGFAFLGENTVPSRLPIRWNVWKIVGAGVSFGCLLFLTAIIFVCSLNVFPSVFNVRSLNDDGKRAALFLQTSIANQAVVFLARYNKRRLVACPAPSILGAFSVLQMAATLIAVYSDLGFHGVKGIGWGWAGVIWMYSSFFLVVIGLFKFVADRSIEKAYSWIRIKGAKIISYMSQHLFMVREDQLLDEEGEFQGEFDEESGDLGEFGDESDWESDYEIDGEVAVGDEVEEGQIPLAGSEATHASIDGPKAA